MKKLRKEIRLILVLLTVAIIFTGCKEDENEPEPDQNNVRLVQDNTLGNILVDSEGFTLYYFSNDADGSSTCTGGCLDAWPVFYQENISAGSGLESADFATITRPDGTSQSTYKGWPLYYFANDNAPGDTNGEGVGNIWFVAKPDYTLMIANQVLEEGGDRQNYLVDAEGNTLYLFTVDDQNVSNCTGNCIQNWPAFFEDNEIILPSIMNMTDLGIIDRPDDGQQYTYQGNPLLCQ